ncbi:MAG: DUF488 family protein [Rhodospirillaceae bacterium]
MTTVYTIGHGNRAAAEFRELLQDAGVRHLIDVRAHPGSRRHPQFSKGVLEADLIAAGIAYSWAGDALGGRRKPRRGSRHIAWRNDSFRAYADHMETQQFVDAMDRLIGEAADEPTAVMCAERLPWQCHRYLIADYLVSRGMRVVHLIGPGSRREHTLNDIARIDDGVVVYDRTAQLGLGLAE